ncbi:hypothetical protein G9A89_010632 [Geosiphon pyriformis]|nr:hypothetical protein G9A89_010632 [Geosiphon pyriformis]
MFSTQTKDEIPQHTNLALVGLCYSLSALGTITALELIGRRTSHLGIWNFLKLFGAGFSMEFVGIWAMHFSAMKAMTLGDGRPEDQLQYKPLFILLSLFLPIIVITLAFYMIGSQPKVNHLRLFLGGSVLALSIGLLHFCAQFAIINYTVQYNPFFFAAAIIVAAVFSNAGLYIFYALRAQWQSDWYKRLGCALLLAFGITGTHFTASAGTHYWRIEDPDTSDTISDDLILAFILMGSIVCGTILLGITVVARAVNLKTKRHAQKVVLGIAIYNTEGLILVSHEGTIPFRKITNEYYQQSLDDEFTVYHPIFQWLFRLTHEWESLKQWLPSIEKHLDSFDNPESFTATFKVPYTTLFREMFIVNAKKLAESLGIPLEESGVLFDNILNTGHMENGSSLSSISSNIRQSDETGLYPVRNRHMYNDEFLGKGQMLFLVQKIKDDSDAAEQFQRLGYRFVEPQLVAPLMAANIRVSCDLMLDYLQSMRTYVNDGMKPLLQSGCVYAGLLVLQPKVEGLQVLVLRDSRHQIPIAQLPSFSSLNKAEQQLISRKSGTTLLELGSRLSRKILKENKRSKTPLESYRSRPTSWTSMSSGLNSINDAFSTDTLKKSDIQDMASLQPSISDFNGELLQALNKLIAQVGDQHFYAKSILFPKVVEITIPESETNGRSKKPAQLILFTSVLSHDQLPKILAGNVCLIPYRLLRTYQDVVYQDSPDEKQAWHKKLGEELGEVVFKALNNIQSFVPRVRSNSISSFEEKSLTNGFEFMVYAQQEVVEEVTVVIENKKQFDDVDINNSDQIADNQSWDQFEDESDRVRLPRVSHITLPEPKLTTTISTWNKEKRWFEEVVKHIGAIEFDQRETFTAK